MNFLNWRVLTLTNPVVLDGALAAWYVAIAEFARGQGGIFRTIGNDHFQIVSRALIADLNGVFVKGPRSNYDLVAAAAQSQVDFGFPWSIQVRENSPSPQLIELAAAHGLSRRTKRPLMIAPVDQPAWPLEQVRDFRLRVANSDDRDAYLAALCAGFSAPAEVMAIFGSVFNLRGATVYVVENSSRVVATGLVMLVCGWATIYNVATIPDFRRRGLATSLLRRILRDAYEAGAHHAVLQSSETGLRLYEANGFKVAERWSIFAKDK